MDTTPEKVVIVLVGSTEFSGQFQYFFKAMREGESVLTDTLALDHRAKESEIQKFSKGLRAKAEAIQPSVGREIR